MDLAGPLTFASLGLALFRRDAAVGRLHRRRTRRTPALGSVRSSGPWNAASCAWCAYRRTMSRAGGPTPSPSSSSRRLSFAVVVAIEESRAPAPAQPVGLRPRRTVARTEHRGHLRHDDELAELREREHDEQLQADGGPRGTAVHRGCGGDRRRSGRPARPDAPTPPDDRQLLGRYDAHAPCTSCCRWRSSWPSSMSGRAVPTDHQWARPGIDSAGRHPVDCARAHRVDGSNQDPRLQRRRLPECERRAPIRQSDADHELARPVHQSPDPVRPDRDLRTDGRQRPPRLGHVRGDGDRHHHLQRCRDDDRSWPESGAARRCRPDARGAWRARSFHRLGRRRPCGSHDGGDHNRCSCRHVWQPPAADRRHRAVP